MQRVVITGVGAISSLGLGADTNFSRALSGQSGIDLLHLPFAADLTCGVAAQIKYALPELIKKSEGALFDQFALFAWIAANEALRALAFIFPLAC